MGFAETFKALSDSVRRDILMLLREGRMSAGEILSTITVMSPISRSTIWKR